jgi:hypothetical protein
MPLVPGRGLHGAPAHFLLSEPSSYVRDTLGTRLAFRRFLGARLEDRNRRHGRGFVRQGRQDSNLEPPVLETGALPVELRPSARRHCTGVRRRPLGALFAVLALGFLFVGLYAADAGGAAWVIAAAAVFIAVWMGELAYKMLK